MEKPNKSKKKLLIIVAICIVVVGAVFAAIKLAAPADPNKTINIKSNYLTLRYPEKYEKYLKHEEILQGADSTVVFSMVYEDIEAELFRLFITAEAPEEYEGYFSVDNDVMYVSIKRSGVDSAVFGTAESDEALEERAEVEALYYSMLDGMSTVMEAVYSDSRYSAVRGVFESEKQKGKLSYWELSLPAEMTYEETEENGVYRVTFFGDIDGKKVKLYTVSLGDASAESYLGQYVVNGESRLLSVALHDIEAGNGLNNEQREMAYALLDTINDVLQSIRADKNFFDQIEPAA